MALSAAGALVMAGSAYMSYSAQERAARDAADAAQREAEQEILRSKREEEIARQKKEADITMAAERLAFEKESRKSKADYTIGQMNKVEAELYASAVAGFAASGIDISKSSSALAVFNRIQSESDIQESEVRKDYDKFAEARELEFEQLKTTEELSYEWFTTRLHQERDWTVQNKYAEASAYRSKARYANYGAYLGAASSGMQGYKLFA